jgi:hypothetical protein
MFVIFMSVATMTWLPISVSAVHIITFLKHRHICCCMLSLPSQILMARKILFQYLFGVEIRNESCEISIVILLCCAFRFGLLVGALLVIKSQE